MLFYAFDEFYLVVLCSFLVRVSHSLRRILELMVYSCYICNVRVSPNAQLRRVESLIDDNVAAPKRGFRATNIRFCGNCAEAGQSMCLPVLDMDVVHEWMSFCRVRAEITDLRRCLGSVTAAFAKQSETIALHSERDQRNHKALEFLYRQGRVIYDPWFRDVTADLGVLQLRDVLARAHAIPGTIEDRALAEWWFYIFTYIVRFNRSVVKLAGDIWRAASTASAEHLAREITHHSITTRGIADRETMVKEVLKLRTFFQSEEGCSAASREFGRIAEILMQSVFKRFDIPIEFRPSLLVLSSRDHFRAYFISKLALRAHGPEIITVEEYPGPSLVAKSQQENESMVQLHDFLHGGTSQHMRSLDVRRRWWDRCFHYFTEARRVAREVPRTVGEAEHSGCEFVRMQRNLYDLDSAIMMPKLKPIMSKKRC